VKIIFIPIGIITGLIAGQISKKIFDLIWRLFADEEAPEPEHREISWPKLLLALTLEGAIFRAMRGVAERGSRIGFYRLTGSWPGEEEPEPT
jgi:hypothetical protein